MVTREELNKNIEELMKMVNAHADKVKAEKMDAFEREEIYAVKLAEQRKRDQIVAHKSNLRKKQVDAMKRKLIIAGMTACLVLSTIGVTRSIARGRISQRVNNSGLVPKGVNSVDRSNGVSINYTDSYGNVQVMGAEYFVSMFPEDKLAEYGITADEFAIYLGHYLGITESMVEGSTTLGREKKCIEELGCIIMENIDEQVEEAISGQAYIQGEESEIKSEGGRSR